MTIDKMRRKRSAILSVAFWSKTMEDQLSLFDKKEFSPSNIQSVLMPKDFLLDWKEKIFNNQQFIKNSFTSRQTNLFTDREQFDPNKIDPFDLLFFPLEFYPSADTNESNCLYFLVDLAKPILLYIGETKQNPKKRWLNHDCRDYIANYRDLHYRYKLNSNLRLAFWWDIPRERKERQDIESFLIGKWQPPFNRESWNIYGQPFKKLPKFSC